jgi:RND family efflux transporter MFP subunit
MSKVTTLGLLAGAVLVLAGCGGHSARKPKLAEIDRVPRLETITPRFRETFALPRDYTVTVEPLEKADLYPQVRGVVEYLSPNADIGRSVRGSALTRRAAATGVAMLGVDPLAGAATLLAGHGGGEVLVQLAIPDVLAERDNKKALLDLSREALALAHKAREVAAREVKEADAQRKRYQADVAFRAVQHNRMVRLVSQDTVQKQQAEETELQYRSATAALEASEAQLLTKHAKLAQAEADIGVAEAKIRVARAELERLEAMVGFATIRAPFDGVVTKRWLDRGAIVKDFATPLLTVMRTDVVRVLIDVPEPEAPFFRAAHGSPAGGNPVILRVPALRDRVPGGQFAGQVTLTASALDRDTRTMRVEVWLPNPNRYLLPQMTGTATVVLEERRNVFTLPSSALVRHGDKASVYCVVEAKGDPPRGVVRRLTVEVGVDNGEVAEIRRGLTGSEKILAKGQGMVREGDFAIAVPAR